MGPDGQQIGVVSTREAQRMADQAGLDLVEISATARPPVCRVMDYGKFKYDQEKKERLARRNQTATRVKEVQFHPGIGDHDYQTKVRHIREFIEEGHRVRVCLSFRGRENIYRERGFEVMNKIVADTQDVSVAEQLPKLMGRNIIMTISPRPGVRKKTEGGKPAEPEAGADS